MSIDSGDRFDKLIARLHNEMKTRVERTATAFRNEQVPDRQRVPEAQQVQEYIQVRDNPEAWSSLMQERGIKSAIKYYKAGERMVDKFTKKALQHTQLPGMDVPEIPKRPMSQAFINALMGQVQQIQQSVQPQPLPEQPVDPMTGGAPMDAQPI